MAGPTIKIDPPPDVTRATDGNPLFSITAEPKMPALNIAASVVGFTTDADPTPTTSFAWTAEITYDSAKTPHGRKVDGMTHIASPVTASGTSIGGAITVNFDRIRGGTLTITVTATVDGQVLTAKTDGWRIQGSNPSMDDVANALPDDAFRRITCVESGMKQFFPAPGEGGAWYPFFSGDRLLGAGICQLTTPAPTDDQLWNWKENVSAGITLYNQKRAAAKGYPGAVSHLAGFQSLVKQFNDSLKAQGVNTPVAVSVPPFTDDQLDDDTIRGFNGYAGSDLGGHLHEFRIQRDASGALVVDGDPNTGEVCARWERVPAADRPQSGDPNYVSDVKERDPRTCAKT
jgi:hypothetical protein